MSSPLGRQIVAMPAVIVLGLWIALQLVSGVGSMGYTDASANTGGVIWPILEASSPGS
ncbi:MAG: hypothetical protein WA441_06195 [Methyloceanibacter sp.]